MRISAVEACASVAAMDAAAAIAELRELSTQIEAVVVAARDGSVVSASIGDMAAGRVAAAARDIADGADQVRRDLGREALSQLQASTPTGSVFVVVDEDRMAVATTGADPTVGLVFYDLKTLLRQIADDGEPVARGEEPGGQA
jgi:predicted regulator of Ras-like GTPase activity (Roadblock/LC7/MglB family)